MCSSDVATTVSQTVLSSGGHDSDNMESPEVKDNDSFSSDQSKLRYKASVRPNVVKSKPIAAESALATNATNGLSPCELSSNTKG